MTTPTQQQQQEPPPRPAPLTPSARLALEQKARYDRLTRNLAIGGVIACPLIALLPPRKLDLYTFSLAVGFYLSADHLAQGYNGRPLVQQFRFGRNAEGAGGGVMGLPTEKAERLSRMLKERRKEEERVRREGLAGLRKDGAGEETEAEDKRSVLQRVWMGGETEGWKERRMEEERRALREGKSYMDIIFGQVWEVWNWDDGRKKRKGGEAEGEEGKKE